MSESTGQRDSDDSSQSAAAPFGGVEDIEMAEDEENIDLNIQQLQTADGNNIPNFKLINNNQENQNYMVSDNVNQTVDQADSEVTEITLTTDSEGRYIITTPQNMAEGQCIPMPENKEFEDSMYNLQMLGEVAMKKTLTGSDIP